MKELKHSLTEFTKVFENNIKVSDFAEFKLCTCNLNERIEDVKIRMENV